MNSVDVAIIVVVAVMFSAALGYIIYRKAKHKGSCDCGDCAACCGCAHKDEHKAKNGCGRCGKHESKNAE